MALQETEEYKRTQDPEERKRWQRWGPYLSNRQWGTVREQYNLGPFSNWGQLGDEAWHNLSYLEASGTAYQFGEDGIFGISDDDQYLCFSLAFWNHQKRHDGNFRLIKERFFGLSGIFGGDEEGSQHEDVKELYYYLCNTPSHSYMKAVYKYPCNPYPYNKILDNNKRHKISNCREEYEILDTEVFADDDYFNIIVEYAKEDWNKMVIKITVTN